MTSRPPIFERSVMMSSLIPSEKYSCSGSPDMLVKGRTAIEGGRATGFGAASIGRVAATVAGCHFQMRIGRSTFLTPISPASMKRCSMRLPTLSLTIDEMQIPPSSASGSSLTTAAKRSLAKKKSLRATVKVTFAPKTGASASKSMKVTFKQPRVKKKSRSAKT